MNGELMLKTVTTPEDLGRAIIEIGWSLGTPQMAGMGQQDEHGEIQWNPRDSIPDTIGNWTTMRDIGTLVDPSCIWVGINSETGETKGLVIGESDTGYEIKVIALDTKNLAS